MITPKNKPKYTVLLWNLQAPLNLQLHQHDGKET